MLAAKHAKLQNKSAELKNKIKSHQSKMQILPINTPTAKARDFVVFEILPLPLQTII